MSCKFESLTVTEANDGPDKWADIKFSILSDKVMQDFFIEDKNSLKKLAAQT